MKPLLLALALALLAAPALPQTDEPPTWLTDPPNPLDLAVTGAEDRALEAIVGPKGGRFKLEDAAGNRFTLDFPKGALLTDTLIRMTPIATSDGLPEGAGSIVGLLLEPDGLRLARDAVLEIRPVAEIAPGDRLHWGFYGGGADAFLHIPDLTAEGIVIPLDHFSGAGVSIADRINLQLDRWRQKSLEDRISTQIHETLRESKCQGSSGTRELGEALLESERLVTHGLMRLVNSPVATCTNITRAVEGVLSLQRQKQLLDLGGKSLAEYFPLIDKGWTLCFPEEEKKCHQTGNLGFILNFASGGNGKGRSWVEKSYPIQTRRRAMPRYGLPWNAAAATRSRSGPMAAGATLPTSLGSSRSRLTCRSGWNSPAPLTFTSRSTARPRPPMSAFRSRTAPAGSSTGTGTPRR